MLWVIGVENPAFATSTSKRPNAFTAARTASAPAPGFETSAATSSIFAPGVSWRIEVLADSSEARERETRTTDAPARA
jgi:hypothetical protein